MSFTVSMDEKFWTGNKPVPCGTADTAKALVFFLNAFCHLPCAVSIKMVLY
jgi:hypothetical protein